MSKVLAIYTAKSAAVPMQSIEQAQLEAGRGMVGDRYYCEQGTFSERLAGLPDKELTLIESEAVDAFNREQGFEFNYGDFRRNIVTQGVRLNELEGREFSLGGVRLRGVRLCEPCAHLADILTDAIMPALVHKTGLRAEIISSGNVQLGDPLTTA